MTMTDRINGFTAAVAIKAPCRVVAASNITLSGLQTIGGVVLVAGDRVLVKGQTDATENGIYEANSSAWIRARDFDGNRDVVQGTRVAVVYENGSTGVMYAVATANPVVIGVSEITFTLAPENAFVSVLTSGAVGDGLTDNYTFITAAMSEASSAGGGMVYFPSGVYVTSPLTIPSKVTLIGARSEDGWARLTPSVYEMGSVLKLKANSNAPLIRVLAATQLWGLQDLVLDGNKDNQTSYASHCIKTESGASRNFGGSIKGVRCVNPKGWGGYFTGGPLNISDSFFMSGAVFCKVSDLKMNNVDLDGTDGYHSSLCMVRTTTSSMSNVFVYGWGEVDGTTLVQNVNGTINADSTVTVSAGSYLYEDAPVLLSGATVSGANSQSVYFAHNVSGTTWEFYTVPYAASGFSPAKVTFSPASGSVNIRHGGSNEAANMSYCYGNSFSGGRIAGAKSIGLRLVESDRNNFVGIQCFNNNMGSNTGAATVNLYDSDENSFSACQLGEQASLGARRVDHAVSTEGTSKGNKFDESNQYLGTNTALVVVDTSSQSYRNRNIYKGVIGYQDSGTTRLSSPTNLREPLVHFGAYTVTSDTTIAAATNGIKVPLTARKQSGMSLASNEITITAERDTVYEISGQFGITGFDATTTYVLVKLVGLNSAMGSTEYRVAVPLASAVGVYLSIPFNFKLYCSSDCVNTLSLEVYQPASAGTFRVVSDARYSYVTVQKLADLPA